MSFVVVMNGPVARAGSKFSFFNNNGTTAPVIAAMIITNKRDNEMTREMINSPCQ